MTRIGAGLWGQFQFTPLREGRLTHALVQPIDIQFQFTPLREGRPDGYAPCEVIFFISIHAPPRGAT